ncbi:hypothetical protein RHGRI_012275 [Rhododendron griersonianum]|uniref:Uncharacterized protein n=1 Tax=Rhododendron griersonianum TaxID=479676 RepID=A0AAV6KPX0_9ERIC|nr:hypothetical protein RHGRI_012275 [Rhododendron griersonianum]
MATKVKPPLLPLFFSVTLFLLSVSLPLRLLNQPHIEGKEQHAGDGGGSGGDGGMGGEDLEEKYKELCDKQPPRQCHRMYRERRRDEGQENSNSYFNGVAQRLGVAVNM